MHSFGSDTSNRCYQINVVALKICGVEVKWVSNRKWKYLSEVHVFLQFSTWVNVNAGLQKQS